MQEEIYKAIQQALAALGVEGVEFVVERPANLANGDYATNVALIAAKKLGKNPKEVAQQLQERLSVDSVEKIEVAGAGFINFHLSREAIASEVQKAATNDSWGKNDLYKDQKIMVEYTDPNPFKEFHIGHLMSNAIGEAIARTLEVAGANVIRANYQGDVGPHVAKAIWGKMQNPDISWGEAYVAGSAAYEDNKAEIDAINKSVYKKDNPEITALYDAGRKESLAHFEGIYKKLGTTFDHYFFESETSNLGLEIVHKHPEVFVKSDGAIVFKGEDVGLHTRVFINSQGLPTYEAKDLGLLSLKKKKENLDESITVTANEQNEYFKVVLAAAKQIPELADIANKTKHISHGMMRFAQGKMSSRRGNVITGESLLSDLQEAAKEKMAGRELQDATKVAEQVAVGAIKYTVLKQGSGKDIVFDPEKSLSLEGDSGPYLQYALVRARSLLRKASDAAVTEDVAPQIKNIERVLVHYVEVVERSSREMEPHYLATYLTELASEVNSWYANERAIVDGEIAGHTLKLIQATEHTLAQGLNLLGIPTPEEM